MLNTFRLLIATLVPFGVLLLLPIGWGAFKSYIYSLPVICFCSGKIIQLKNPKFGTSIAALMISIPALGYASSKYAVALMDMNYLAKHQAAAHALRLFYFSMSGIGPIVCATALTGWLIGSRHISALFGVAGISSLAGERVLRLAVVNLDHGDPSFAAQMITLCEILRITTFAAAVLIALKAEHRVERGLIAIAAILGMWITVPPLALQLSSIPTGKARNDGPVGIASLGVGMNSADPSKEEFVQQLNAQGSVRFNNLKWWCNPNPRPDWTNAIRATTALALPADSTLKTLEPHLEEIFSRGITQMAFIGQAPSPNPLSPLSKHLTQPAVRWITEPPPQDAFWGKLTEDGSVSWTITPTKKPKERIACALWVDQNTTIQHLFDVGQKWGIPQGICAHGLFLVFGTPQHSDQSWKAPLRCD